MDPVVPGHSLEKSTAVETVHNNNIDAKKEMLRQLTSSNSLQDAVSELTEMGFGGTPCAYCPEEKW